MRFVKAVASLIGMLVILIGVPVLLVRLVGWPGPDHVPGFGEVRRQVMQRDFGASFIIGALAVIGWVLWAQVVWATVWELAVNVRRIRINIRPRRPPLVAAPIGRIVAGAIITIMAVVGHVQSPKVALATGPLQVSHTPAAHLTIQHPANADNQPTSAATASEQTVSSTPTWVVQRGDTLWDIAEQTLGDGSRVDDIMALNPQIQSAALLSPGDVLTLPGEADIPADRTATVTSPDATTQTSTVTVVRGDTLWDIADDELGDPTRWPEIADANSDQIRDPDLIQPGWTLNMPGPAANERVDITQQSTPTPTPTATAAAADAANNRIAAQQADKPTTVEQATPTTVAGTGSDTAAEQTTPANVDVETQVEQTTPSPATTVVEQVQSPTEPAAPATTVAAEQEPPAAVSSNWPPPAATVDGARPSPSIPVGTLLGSGGVAALVIAMLERRRRQRRNTDNGVDGAGSDSPPAGLVAAEMEVRAAAVQSHRSTVLVVQQMLVELYEDQRLDPRSAPARFEVDDDGTCRVWWSNPTEVLPPFTGTEQCWTINVAEQPERTWSDWEVPVFATLVSLGRCDRSEVFVDLESIGAIAVVGSDPNVDALMRGIVMQFGSPFVEVFADPELSGRELFGSQLPATADVAQLYLDRSAVWGSIEAGELASMVQARVEDYPSEQLRSAVLVTMQPTDPDLVRAARPGRGLAVVQRDVDDVDQVWMFEDDGTLLVQGIRITSPVAITPSTEQVVAELVNHEPEPDASKTDPEVVAADPEVVTVPVATVTPLAAGEPYVPLQWDRLIRVMRRDVDVIDQDDQVVDWVPNGVRLARRCGEVLLFLAFRGYEGATSSQLIEALWYGRNPISPSTLTGVISGVRSIVGAERIETLPAGGWRLAANSGVVTDVDVVAHATAHVRQNPKDWKVLHDALQLVGGQPLSDSESLNWASAYQYLARVDEVINAAITLAATIAFEQDRVDDAAAAAEIGLKANPLNENVVQLAMRAAAAQGNVDKVRRLYQTLVRLLDDQLEEQPFPQTTGLYNELVRGDRRMVLSESRAG